jgi:hypothetical protein
MASRNRKSGLLNDVGEDTPNYSDEDITIGHRSAVRKRKVAKRNDGGSGSDYEPLGAKSRPRRVPVAHSDSEEVDVEIPEQSEVEEVIAPVRELRTKVHRQIEDEVWEKDKDAEDGGRWRPVAKTISEVIVLPKGAPSILPVLDLSLLMTAERTEQHTKLELIEFIRRPEVLPLLKKFVNIWTTSREKAKYYLEMQSVFPESIKPWNEAAEALPRALPVATRSPFATESFWSGSARWSGHSCVSTKMASFGFSKCTAE